MSPVSIFKKLIRLAAWATPHIQRWYREYNVNRTEGERHLKAGNYSEAEKYLLLAAADAEQRHSARGRRIEIQLQLAEALRKQGKLAEAYETAMEAAEQARSKGELYAQCLDRLTAIYSDQGRLPEATEAAGQALQIARAAKPAHPSLVAERCRQLAFLQKQAGDVAGSKKLLEESIQLYEQAFGPEHPETASRMAELGATLGSEGGHAEALLCLNRALKIHQETLGPDSPEAVQDLLQIAMATHAKGDLEEASKEYERTLRFKEMQVGPDKEELISLLSHMADLYVAMERYSRAQELLYQTTCLLGRQPQRLVEALDKLAAVCEVTNRIADAQKYRAQAAATRQKLAAAEKAEAERQVIPAS